jgi:hypothetical protein
VVVHDVKTAVKLNRDSDGSFQVNGIRDVAVLEGCSVAGLGE